MTLDELVGALGGRLIVSCQASAGSPMRDTSCMVRVAQAVVAGGAAGVRCGGVGGIGDVAAVAAAVEVPVIGLTKEGTTGVYITPTVGSCLDVRAAGADVVATDATGRYRPDGSTLANCVEAVHAAGGLLMADVSMLDEGLRAAEAGADLLATTLAGYTPGSKRSDGPDIGLVHELRLAMPRALVIAEGRYHTPQQCSAALEAGATAVVVGTAITDPAWITAAFSDRMRGSTRSRGS